MQSNECEGNNAACGLEVLAAERERDEAQITCAKLERAIKMNAATHERRMPVPDSDALRARAEQAERERDEARHQQSQTLGAALAAQDDAREAIRERDEAQAALVALREAVTALVPPVVYVSEEGIAFYAVPSMGLDVALSAFPVTLAGQVRARVLREAVIAVERWMDTDDDPLSMIDRLHAIADEAEKKGGLHGGR